MKPLAQTFRIDSIKYRNGMVLTAVEIFLSQKPGSNGWPILVELRSVENRIPTTAVMPGSSVYLGPSQVNTPSVGDSDDIDAIRLAGTKFTFDEPIYLTPGREYAIVVYSNSPEYQLYGARTYEYLIGTTEKRINKLSELQDLYLTQTGTTWIPDTSLDLMVKLYKASFTPFTTYSAILENAETPRQLLGANPLLMDSGDATITMLHPNHGFVVNDFVAISGLDSSTTYNGILGTSILGNRQITAVDHTGYTFEADSTAAASLRTGGTGIIVSKQVMMDEYNINLSTLQPRGTDIVPTIKLTSGASFANNRNSATNSAYAKDASFKTTSLNTYIKNVSPELIATSLNEATHNSNEKSVTLKLDIGTIDSNVSPIIDLQRSSINGIENVIDNQDSVASTGFNVPLSFVAETDPQDGTSASKHITKPVTLAETAVGLKVLLAANRPSEADFKVYWRTSTGDEVITDKAWALVNKDVIIAPDEDPTIFREYSYLVGGVNGTLTPFSVFQIKIVFTSTNSSKVARIKDLRAIALVV